MGVSLDNGTIHTPPVRAKIIGVNDQTAHRVSLAGSKKGAMPRECLSRIQGSGDGLAQRLSSHLAPAAAAEALAGAIDRPDRESDSP